MVVTMNKLFYSFIEPRLLEMSILFIVMAILLINICELTKEREAVLI